MTLTFIKPWACAAVANRKYIERGFSVSAERERLLRGKLTAGKCFVGFLSVLRLTTYINITDAD